MAVRYIINYCPRDPLLRLKPNVRASVMVIIKVTIMLRVMVMVTG